ncbi:MAG: transcription-repair coupling factor [Chloroflexi bacterium]|nr:transcription-repair coupling factor [Chloroflexota bacterium]
MNLSGLLSLLNGTPEFQALLSRLDAGTRVTEPLEVLDAARPYVLAALHQYWANNSSPARPIVVVTARTERAKQVWVDLTAWSTQPERIFYFAEPDPLLYERMPWNVETIALRLAALSALARHGQNHASDILPPLVITTMRALMLRTAPRAEFQRNVFVLKRGENLSLTNLLRAWSDLGYEAAPVVDAPGLFSRRGGIVDIWLPSRANPVRIELIGDEIESLREFDPTTQRSGRVIETLLITPASEAEITRAPQAAELVQRLDLSTVHPVAANTFRQDLDALASKRRFRGIEFYLPYLYTDAASLIDYLPEHALIVADDWQELEAMTEQFEQQAEQVRADLEGRGEIPREFAKPYFTWHELRDKLLQHSRLLFDYRGVEDAPALPFAPGERFGGQVKRVVDDMLQLRSQGARVIAVTRQAERLADLLREREFFVKPKTEITHAPEAGHIVLIQGALTEGFTLRDEVKGLRTEEDSNSVLSPLPSALVLLTDAEIFGWSRPKPRRLTTQYARPQAPEAFFADLSEGDFVVHIDHGIGVFRGLQKLDLGGPDTEYLLLEYAQGDRLYVPVHQLDRLSRYVAPGGHKPTLHRLGTAEWAQVKERTKKAVADIAQELLELYATREIVTGHAYPQDTQWQHELEASFPYIETADQLSVIDQVKRDMQQTRPMDRLVVGDVGYGKTEVALRAAFKAVMDGKQVAILVPTTVLAQQHFNTFQERLAPFPVTVEMLSRFRSDKEQDEIVEKLAQGAIDIVIGTHRILSQDVAFKDLGLLIVDEEQRFGVQHKERLKQLRAHVDVLTLTATPIPRTLYLSLSGARDMSTMETPPDERLPIRTYVAPYAEGLVRDAILRELDRGGQVFFVHNRVQGIGIIAEQLRKLAPEARIGIGHGQMPEDQLELVMSEFATGKYDVLVCTTIIESGIDIPNANTMIINNADKFGLAQLYQLRGRVGRSAARAFAYFLYNKQANVSDEARMRLQTIAEASELGAGFQVAMRDLEIRGAGEILGARQSGHITAVGLDLYARLLAGAIEEARAKLEPEHAHADKPADGKDSVNPAQRLLNAPSIDLPLVSQIPEEYVADAALRLRLYRRLADVGDEKQIADMVREFQERFGALPEAVENLFYLLRLKLAATRAEIATITLDDGRIMARFRSEDNARLERLNKTWGDRVRASRDRMWLAGPESDAHWREHLMQVLAQVGRYVGQ